METYGFPITRDTSQHWERDLPLSTDSKSGDFIKLNDKGIGVPVLGEGGNDGMRNIHYSDNQLSSYGSMCYVGSEYLVVHRAKSTMANFHLFKLLSNGEYKLLHTVSIANKGNLALMVPERGDRFLILCGDTSLTTIVAQIIDNKIELQSPQVSAISISSILGYGGSATRLENGEIVVSLLGGDNRPKIIGMKLNDDLSVTYGSPTNCPTTTTSATGFMVIDSGLPNTFVLGFTKSSDNLQRIIVGTLINGLITCGAEYTQGTYNNGLVRLTPGVILLATNVSNSVRCKVGTITDLTMSISAELLNIPSSSTASRLVRFKDNKCVFQSSANAKIGVITYSGGSLTISDLVRVSKDASYGNISEVKEDSFFVSYASSGTATLSRILIDENEDIYTTAFFEPNPMSAIKSYQLDSERILRIYYYTGSFLNARIIKNKGGFIKAVPETEYQFSIPINFLFSFTPISSNEFLVLYRNTSNYASVVKITVNSDGSISCGATNQITSSITAHNNYGDLRQLANNRFAVAFFSPDSSNVNVFCFTLIGDVVSQVSGNSATYGNCGYLKMITPPEKDSRFALVLKMDGNYIILPYSDNGGAFLPNMLGGISTPANEYSYGFVADFIDSQRMFFFGVSSTEQEYRMDIYFMNWNHTMQYQIFQYKSMILRKTYRTLYDWVLLGDRLLVGSFNSNYGSFLEILEFKISYDEIDFVKSYMFAYNTQVPVYLSQGFDKHSAIVAYGTNSCAIGYVKADDRGDMIGMVNEAGKICLVSDKVTVDKKLIPFKKYYCSPGGELTLIPQKFVAGFSISENELIFQPIKL